MSIPLYCYKQLSDCISQIDQLGVKVEGLLKTEEEQHSPPESKLFGFENFKMKRIEEEI
jgi:hypothetical protein